MTGMKTYEDLCLHPREATIVLRTRTSKSGAVLQLVRCTLCDREWERWRDAGGEDI